MQIEESSSQKSKRPSPLHWRDDEDLLWFFEVGADLVQRSSLGHQLESLRDNVRIVGIPNSDPGWNVDFGRFTDSAKASRVWRRLQASREHYVWAPLVLSQYYAPTSVSFPGDRLLSLFPLTSAASFGLIQEVQGKGEGLSCRWPRPRAIPSGASPRANLDSLLSLESQSRAAYRPIRREAQTMLDRTTEAWRAARN